MSGDEKRSASSSSSRGMRAEPSATDSSDAAGCQEWMSDGMSVTGAFGMTTFRRSSTAPSSALV